MAVTNTIYEDKGNVLYFVCVLPTCLNVVAEPSGVLISACAAGGVVPNGYVNMPRINKPALPMVVGANVSKSTMFRGEV